MAVSETPRFGLPQWSEDTDPITRTMFDTAFATLDEKVANAPAFAIGDPTVDVFQVIDVDGEQVLQFSDGVDWFDAKGIVMSDIPFQINVDDPLAPYVEFDPVGDGSWQPIEDPNAARKTLVVLDPLTEGDPAVDIMRIVNDGSDNAPYLQFSDGTDYYDVATWDAYDPGAPHFRFMGATGTDSTGGTEYVGTGHAYSMRADLKAGNRAVLFWASPGNAGGSNNLDKWHLMTPDIIISDTEPSEPVKGSIWVPAT